MSNSIKDVDVIKDTVNIVDVISKVVELKQMGTNHKGLCPFHNEKTPSFTVTENKQMYKCFGCSEGGDVIQFVQKYYNLSFKEAIEMLANDYGIKIEHKYEKDKGPYYQANSVAAKCFHENFTCKNNKALSYMQHRKINIKTLKKFGIGYARDSWNELYDYMIAKGISQEVVLELGLAIKKTGKNPYDNFRDRVMFPIFNSTGKVIGFGGRAIGEKLPKYLNSPESLAFNKRYNLYALNFAKQEIGKLGIALLVEGYMDVISLWDAGVKNSVATLGTAFTSEQAKLISRYTKEVVIAYDSDEAGQKATLKAIDELQKEKCNAKVIVIEGAKDPDEYIKKYGKESFDKLISDSITAVDFKLDYAKKGLNIHKDQDKITYMSRAVDVLVELSPVEQEIYVAKTAKYLNMGEIVVKKEVELRNSSTRDNLKYSNSYQDIDSYDLSGTDNNFPPEYYASIDLQYDEDYPYEGEQGLEQINTEPYLQYTKEYKDSNNIKVISLLEKHLIKLFYINKDYLIEIDKVDGILSSDISLKLRNIFRNEYENKQSIDKNSVIKLLNESEAKIFSSILDDIIINGEDEQIFQDCIDTHEKNCMKEYEIKLKAQLREATRDGDLEKEKAIMADLYNLQKKIKGA